MFCDVMMPRSQNDSPHSVHLPTWGFMFKSGIFLIDRYGVFLKISLAALR